MGQELIDLLTTGYMIYGPAGAIVAGLGFLIYRKLPEKAKHPLRELFGKKEPEK
jgi:hypothetical protein